MVYYRRWARHIDQPIRPTRCASTLAARSSLRGNCKARSSTTSRPWATRPTKVIDEGDWYYFPHMLTEDYAAGWYDEVEAMQGKYDTYYAGEVMSFGDMDETCEYSRELVERFF
jgi:hypothetical protein